MVEWLMELDREACIMVNGAGSPYLDQLMIWVSDRYIWLPLYGFLMFRLYQQYGYRFFIPLLALVLIVLCADQLTSSLMKPYFGRLRPCKDPLLEPFLVSIGKCRGSFGFASGHATNAFALAGFFYFLYKAPLGKLMFIWAALIAYSRVYLGVHYPGDVLVGAALGLTLSYLIVQLLKLVFPELKACSLA